MTPGAAAQDSRDSNSPPGPFGWLYHALLGALEKGILCLLLFLTVGVSFVEILNRNLGWELWDSAAAAKMVYAFTFWLGLFGAVVASRRLEHIRIDALSPHLGPRGRAALDVLASAVGLIAAAWLASTTHRYIDQFIPAHETFLPGQLEPYWNLRLWRWPMVVALAWMALHFAVQTGLKLAALRPSPPGSARPPGGAI